MSSYERINDVLVNLFRDILSLEEKAMAGSAFKDLSMNDWHVIEAVGLNTSKSMSQIARELSITLGSLTIAMNGLYKKGYVERRRGEKDRRVVHISLTEKGVAAYKEHEHILPQPWQWYPWRPAPLPTSPLRKARQCRRALSPAKERP